jgi:hypothetical protein
LTLTEGNGNSFKAVGTNFMKKLLALLASASMFASVALGAGNTYTGTFRGAFNGSLAGGTNLPASGISTSGGTPGQILLNTVNGTVWTNDQSIVQAGSYEFVTATTNPITGQITYTVTGVNTNQFLGAGPGGYRDAGNVTNINAAANGLVPNNSAGIAAAGGVTNLSPWFVSGGQNASFSAGNNYFAYGTAATAGSIINSGAILPPRQISGMSLVLRDQSPFISPTTNLVFYGLVNGTNDSRLAITYIGSGVASVLYTNLVISPPEPVGGGTNIFSLCVSNTAAGNSGSGKSFTVVFW